MNDPRAMANQGEGRLWAISLLVSLVLNAVLFLSLGVLANIRILKQPPAPPPLKVEPKLAEIVIIPTQPAASQPSVAVERTPSPPPPPPSRPESFARTSPDQQAAKPARPAFIGERDTEAVSDAKADPKAPEMPAQKGVDPIRDEIEATESRYQDGKLGELGKAGGDPALAATPPPAPNASPRMPEPTPPPTPPSPPEPTTEARKEPVPPPPPTPEPMKRDALAQGPNPVEIPIPPDPKPVPPPPPEPPAPETTRAETLPKPKPPVPPPTPSSPNTPKPTVKDPTLPGFAGNQKKTRISGSITRSGKSSLAVENTPMGRYQAAVSRAVEQEWQRNCIRYRDFITPGFLTARFVVEPSGKVRSVTFVENVQGSEVQKGFTLDSIRRAEIPAMPADLKRELDSEPLELLFNFYF